MWRVSSRSRSGVATLRTAIHLLLTYLLTYVAGPLFKSRLRPRNTHTHRQTDTLITILRFAIWGEVNNPLLYCCRSPAAERHANIQLHFEHKLMSYDMDKRQLVFERSASECSRSLAVTSARFAVFMFTARCYASAVLAMALCPSLRLSVTSRSTTKTAERIELMFGL